MAARAQITDDLDRLTQKVTELSDVSHAWLIDAIDTDTEREQLRHGARAVANVSLATSVCHIALDDADHVTERLTNTDTDRTGDQSSRTVATALDELVEPHPFDSPRARAETVTQSVTDADADLPESDSARTTLDRGDLRAEFDRLLEVDRTEAFTLGVDGVDEAANADRLVRASSMLNEWSDRADRAYRASSWMREPDVPKPFGRDEIARAGGDLRTALDDQAFSYAVFDDMRLASHQELLRDEDGDRWVWIDPTDDDMREGEAEVERIRTEIQGAPWYTPAEQNSAPTRAETLGENLADTRDGTEQIAQVVDEAEHGPHVVRGHNTGLHARACAEPSVDELATRTPEDAGAEHGRSAEINMGHEPPF